MKEQCYLECKGFALICLSLSTVWICADFYRYTIIAVAFFVYPDDATDAAGVGFWTYFG